MRQHLAVPHQTVYKGNDMAKRIVSTQPVITRLQRLTDAEDRLICNYRLLGASGRRLISAVISDTTTHTQAAWAEPGNVTELRGAIKRPESEPEPARLELLTGRESDMVNTYRVMDPETKEMVYYTFYLYSKDSGDDNVVSLRR